MLSAVRNIILAPYKSYGVNFGASPYLTRGSALTGVSGGKTGLLSFWFRNASAAGAYRNVIAIQSGANNRFFVYFDTVAEKLTLYGANSSNATILLNLTTNTYASMTTWKHALMSWDLAGSRVQIYINDVSDAASPTTLTDDTITYSSTALGIGADSIGTAGSKYNGDLADLQVWFNINVDISNASPRRLFINSGLRPVDPRRPAEIYGPPAILFSGRPATTWHTNKGTGGAYTVGTGALAASATNP